MLGTAQWPIAVLSIEGGLYSNGTARTQGLGLLDAFHVTKGSGGTDDSVPVQTHLQDPQQKVLLEKQYQRRRTGGALAVYL